LSQLHSKHKLVSHYYYILNIYLSREDEEHPTFKFKAAVVNISILITDQIAMCNVKGVADKNNYHPVRSFTVLPMAHLAPEEPDVKCKTE